MLITLILFVALLAIGLTAMAPELIKQLKRDREEELIHRGVQYSRAIQHFVKKNGRYPNTIEELQTNGTIHFLRRRYKDPVTGKDFKILHMGDLPMSIGSSLQGAIPVANLAAGTAAAGQQGGFGNNIFASSGFGNNGALGGNSPGGGSSFGGGSTFGGGNTSGGGNSFGGGSTFGGNNGNTFGNSGGAFGSNGSTFGSNGSNNSFFGSQGNPGQNTNQPGSDSGTQNPGSENYQNNEGGPGQTVQNTPGVVSQETGNAKTQVFGGGPIVGVASISKDKSIRVFGKYDEYDKWQFIYDPSTDTGGLISTPYAPPQIQAGTLGTPPNGNNANGSPGGPPGAFGFPGGAGPAPGSPFSPQGGSPFSPQGGGQPQQPQQPQFPPDQGPQ